jgi:hypothetical protein
MARRVDGLQDGQGSREPGYAEHSPSGSDRPVRAHNESEGAQQLRDIDALGNIAGRDRAAGLADEPYLPLAVTQEVVGGQVAMRDLLFVQRAHRVPCLLEIVVRDLVALKIAESGGDGVVVREEGRVCTDLAGQQQSRHRRVRCLRGIGHERCVIKLATHVEGAAPGLVSQPQRLPRGARQSRSLEVTVEDDDLQ